MGKVEELMRLAQIMAEELTGYDGASRSILDYEAACKVLESALTAALADERSAARAEALEEAARECLSKACYYDENNYRDEARIAVGCAAVIRQLKERPAAQDQK